MFEVYLVFVCSLLSFVASQQYAIPYTNIDSLYFSGNQTNGVIYGPFPSGSTSYWSIAQWSNPSEINGGAPVAYGQGPCTDPGTSWYIASPSLRVCVDEVNNAVELAQNSTGIQCGNEYDLFLSPTGGYGGETVNWKTMPALGSLSYVNLTFNLRLVYVNVEASCGIFPECSASPDYAYATAALTLNAGSEALFYQISLFDTRSMSGEPWKCNGFASACQPYTLWFFNSNPYGVDESIGSYGQPCLEDFQFHSYNIDILPHLQKLIANGPMQDKNWQDWTVGGGYIGLGGNGDFQTTLLVSGFQVIYD